MTVCNKMNAKDIFKNYIIKQSKIGNENSEGLRRNRLHLS